MFQHLLDGLLLCSAMALLWAANRGEPQPATLRRTRAPAAALTAGRPGRSIRRDDDRPPPRHRVVLP